MADLNVMAANIKSLLEGVPGVKQAFDHEPQMMSQLPAATLFFDGFSLSEKTNRRQSTDWRWVIRLYIQLNRSDIKVPQTEVRTLINDTIKQLRTDPSLGGSCLFHTVTDGEVFALLEQNNPMMVAELTITATTEEY